MPRIMRLDWKDAIHHVMSRGIEKRLLFMDSQDRDEFTKRLSKCVSETDIEIYAWVLMPNHFHFLLKTGETALSQFMRKLLTGYALYFNNRHDRVGHLFQNRYKSILVQKDLYFQKLIKYIHLNPLQAGMVSGKEGLNEYKWSGHYELLNKSNQRIIKADAVFNAFGDSKYIQNSDYLCFMFMEECGPANVDFSEGSHLIGTDGLLSMDDANEKNVNISGQHRILGNRKFALAILKRQYSTAGGEFRFRKRDSEHNNISKLLTYVEEEWSVSNAMLISTSRKRRITKAREFLSYAFVEKLGLSYVDSGRILNVSKQAVQQAIARICDCDRVRINTIIDKILDK